eukprot:2580055-Alexandrium_andersonii.AAC.1
MERRKKCRRDTLAHRCFNMFCARALAAWRSTERARATGFGSYSDRSNNDTQKRTPIPHAVACSADRSLAQSQMAPPGTVSRLRARKMRVHVERWIVKQRRLPESARAVRPPKWMFAPAVP